jgi:PAS domain S-box-containing protein
LVTRSSMKWPLDMSAKNPTRKESEQQSQRGEALQKEPAFVSAVLKTIGALVVILDRQGRIVGFNRACEEMTGYSFPEVEGRCFWDFLLTADEVESVRTVFEQLRAGQFPKEHENHWVAKDGTPRLIHWTNGCLPNSSGSVEYVIGTGILRDIAARKQSEDAQKTTMQRFHTILSSLYGSILVVNKEDKVEFANQAFCEMFDFGVPPEDLIGLTSGEIIKQIKLCYDDPEKEIGRIGEIVGRQLPVRGEVVVLTGGRTYLRDFIPIVLDGLPYGRAWQHIDVTELRRTQAEVQRISQQRQLALDAAHLGWWHYDPLTRIASWDDRYKEIFVVSGYSRPNDEILKRLHPEDLPIVWSSVEAALNPDNPHPYTAEYRINLPDGSMKWIEAHGLATFEGSGRSRRAVSLVGTVADITERKRAEETFRLTQASIDGAAEMVAWFTSDGSVYYANDATCRTLGYSREDILNMTALDFSPGFTREQYEEHWEEVRRRKSFTLEVIHRRKDGTEYPAEVTVNHIVHGGREFVFAYGRDITARKRAEDALQQSEDRFRTMANAIPQLAWIAKADGYIYWYNQRWYDYTGTTPKQMEGWGWQSVHDPNELPKVMERWTASISTGEPFDMTFPLRGSDGVFRPFLTRIMPLRDEQGRVQNWFGTNTDVTDQKRTEDALRESEERLRLAHQAARIGTFEWNIKTGVNIWSPELEAMYGIAPGTFACTQPAWENLVHPEDRVGAIAAVQRAFETGEPTEDEWRVIWPDGSVHWLFGRFQVLKDAQGNPARLTGVNIDITARKHAEEVLLETEEQFKVLTQNLHSAVALVDEHGAFIIVNGSFRRMFDIPEEEDILNVNSRDWKQWQVFDEHGRLLEVDEHPVRKAVLTNTAVKNQLVALKSPSSQNLRWLLVSAEPILDTQGKLYRLICTYYDITERKQADEVLRTSHERLKKVLEVETVGVMFWDLTTGCMTDANNTFLKLMGYSRREVEARELTWQKLTPPEYIDVSLAEIRKFEMTGRVGPYEKEYLRKDGTRRWLLFAGSSLGGNACVEFCVDIADRKQAESALRKSLAEKEVLLKEIHHRVKNNMQVISSLVDLQTDQVGDAATKAVLQDVTHRVRSMALVHEKLYQSADMARVDFADYARSLLGYLWRAYGTAAANVRLTLDLEQVPISVNSAVPCGLILNELATNALKHAFKNTGMGEVIVSLRGSHAGDVSLRVRDNGKGLPPGFDWKQSKSLGLHLVKILAGQLSATVDVSSVEGTEFSISFGGPNQ